LDYHFPATDLGGITLRVTGFGNPYDDDPFDSARDMERRDHVESKFNVTLDWSNRQYAGAASWSDVPTHMVETVAAGDPGVHLFGGVSAGFWFFQMARQNVLVNMDDWARANLPPNMYEYFGEMRGNVYGFAGGPLGTWHFWGYNRELAERIGIHSTPQQMFTRGNWSWDEFIDYMIEVRDLLPEGAFPMSCESPAITFQGTMAFVNGGYVLNPRTMVPGVTSENYLEAARFISRVFQNNLFTTPSFNASPEGGGTSTWGGHWNMTGLLSFGSGNVLIHTTLRPWGLAGPEFEYGIVVPPWNGDRVTFPASGDWRDLRTANPGYMRSYARDGSVHSLIVGTPAAVTPEVFFNIYMTWHRGNGRDVVGDLHAWRTNTPRTAGLDPLTDLFTELDREIFRWWQADPIWDQTQVVQGTLANNTVGPGAPSPGQWLLIDLQNVFGGGQDPLPLMQAQAGRMFHNAHNTWNVVMTDYVPQYIWELHADFLQGPLAPIE
jgi:hypothetical protein